MTARAILLLLLVFVVAGPARSAEEPLLRDGGGGAGFALADSEDPNARRVYIVQLAEPSAAEFHAGLISKVGTTSGLRPTAKFDRDAAAIKSYTRGLENRQREVLAHAGSNTELIYSYRYGLNGFAAIMTPAAANKLGHLSGVVRVWEDEIRPLATNFSAEFLDLFDSQAGLRSVEGLTGEDVVIAVIDSGIYPEHPAVQETEPADRPSACRSSWAERTFLGLWLCARYNRLPDKLAFEPLEDWAGVCQTGEQWEADDCNNKLLGARWYISGAEASGPIDSGEIRSARDVDGHGTHIATTAAGNRVRASIFGTRIGDVEGMAPRARVAVYKACWLRPGETRAACNTSDLANAIDQAVADGVDIINYSVGASLTETTAPDDIALMNAAKAGVLPVVAAGNNGPNLATVASPAGGPWAISVAASTRDGETSREGFDVTAPASIAARYASREAAFTPPLADVDPIEAELVLADDDTTELSDGSDGTRSDACEPLVNDAEAADNVVLIARGGCDFDVKIANADDAGAVAAIVYNFSDDPIVMQGDPGLSDIPAIMMGQADANLIIAELDANETVTVVLDKSFLLTETQVGNQVAVFSSRGPGPAIDILKPDVTAPGVDILAGVTPEAVNTTAGETFGYLTGTSMSTPHVAGVAALLKEAHPDWTPEAIKSALMTTARQDLTRDAAGTAANAFDIGSGHIVPNAARDPGLVYETSADEYDAFACATDSPAVSAERCQALIDGGQSLAPVDMNQPNIALGSLTASQTVTRRATSVSDSSDTYVAEIEAPDGVIVTVTPPTLSPGPGQTASYDVSFTYTDGPLDLWRFGSLTWRGAEHAVRSTLAVRPVSIRVPQEVSGFGGTGAASFDVEFGYTGSYEARVHGLRLPLVLDGFVDNDPTKTFSFRSTNGVTSQIISVPPDQLYARFSLFDALTDGDDDLDLYVYFCPTDTNCTEVGKSGGPTSDEQVDLAFPAPGNYAVLVHGFETDEISGGPGANYQLLSWSFGVNDDQGNLSVSGPGAATAGATGTVTVNWVDLQSQTIYFGGISHNTPSGLSAITLLTIGN